MKKVVILLVLLTMILLHIDSTKILRYNLLRESPFGFAVVMMGGDISPGKTTEGKGYTGQFILKHWFPNGGKRFEPIHFTLKPGEKIIIHMPVVVPYTGEIIKGKEL